MLKHWNKNAYKVLINDQPCSQNQCNTEPLQLNDKLTESCPFTTTPPHIILANCNASFEALTLLVGSSLQKLTPKWPVLSVMLSLYSFTHWATSATQFLLKGQWHYWTLFLLIFYAGYKPITQKLIKQKRHTKHINIKKLHYDSIQWVSRGLTSHSTLYRSSWGRFLQARWPIQQCQSTEGS